MDEVHRPVRPAPAAHNGAAAAGPHRAPARQPAPAATNGARGRARPHAKPAPKAADEPLCNRCSALCCRYVALPIDTPDTAAEYDNIRWYLMHENIHVFVEDGDWYIAFMTRCKNLRDDNLCGIYETRPRICRGYDTTNCEFHGEEYRYELMFTSADQLQRHAEKELKRSILYKARPKKPKLKRGRNGTRRIELPIA
jgi:Fe-S-cluster containining protein